MGEILNVKNVFATLCVVAGFSPIFFALFDVYYKRKNKK